MRQTSDLILALNPDAVLALGDIQYGSGRRAYALSYNPTWGRFKGITWPAPGNHDFYRSAGADYFEYFGPAVGEFHNAYYSFDVGAWHLVSLNSNYDHCDEITGVDCGDAAVQLRWLRQDLAAHEIAACWRTSTIRASAPARPATTAESPSSGTLSTPPGPTSFSAATITATSASVRRTAGTRRPGGRPAVRRRHGRGGAAELHR